MTRTLLSACLEDSSTLFFSPIPIIYRLHYSSLVAQSIAPPMLVQITCTGLCHKYASPQQRRVIQCIDVRITGQREEGWRWGFGQVGGGNGMLGSTGSYAGSKPSFAGSFEQPLAFPIFSDLGGLSPSRPIRAAVTLPGEEDMTPLPHRNVTALSILALATEQADPAFLF